MDKSEILLHICKQEEWEKAATVGEYSPGSLDTEGFIHCSQPDQVLEVANLFYRDIPNLVLLCIDPGLLDSELRWDPVGDSVFPHIYGPLKTGAVLAVNNFMPDIDGVFRHYTLY